MEQQQHRTRAFIDALRKLLKQHKIEAVLAAEDGIIFGARENSFEVRGDIFEDSPIEVLLQDGTSFTLEP